MGKIKDLYRKISQYPDWTILVLAAIIDLPLTFLGYGSDSDAESVIRTGQFFARTFDYVPSRKPGFFVHETASFFLNSVGGSVLTNLGTLLMSLIALACFMKILRKLHIPNVKLLAAVMMIDPFYWVNSASTMDYLWALGFLLLGFYLLLSKRHLGAGIALGLALGSRFSSVIPVIGILIFSFFTRRELWRGWLLTCLLTLLVGAVCYLPAVGFTEWHPLRLFAASVGDASLWSPVLRAGRFLYKNLMFWSIPALLWMIVIIATLIRKPDRQQKISSTGITYMSLGIIAGLELLFLAFPIEMEYLIASLPFVLMILGNGLTSRNWMLWVLFFLVLISNFLWLNPAHPINPNQATGAVYGLWIEPGYLLQDISSRLKLLAMN